MRKFTYLFLLIVTGFGYSANAQTTKGWFLIGGDVSNIRLDFQEGNTNFDFRLTPKVAWFIEDNFAIGAEVLIGVNTSDGYSISTMVLVRLDDTIFLLNQPLPWQNHGGFLMPMWAYSDLIPKFPASQAPIQMDWESALAPVSHIS
jgi:hypothetical protein